MNKFKLRTWFLIFSMMLCSHAGFSKGNQISCTLLASKVDILPFESVGLSVVLKNEGNEKVEIDQPGELFIYIGRKESGDEIKWGSYYSERESPGFPQPPSKRRLQPKEVLTRTTSIDYDISGKNIFVNPGTLMVKARLGKFETNIVEINIQEPTGSEAEIYKLLKANDQKFLDIIHEDNGNPEVRGKQFLEENLTGRLFTLNLIEKYPYNGITCKVLEDLLGKVSGPTYATYAKFSLARMWMEGIDGQVDYEKATYLLNDLSNNKDNYALAGATYYLAMVMQKQGKVSEAAGYFTKLLESNSESFFMHRANKALEDLNNQPGDVQTAIKRKMKELEKMRSPVNFR